MAGAVLRFRGLPRLGLPDFDDGGYAVTGLRSVSPVGLAGLDPTSIPHAPPGFPILACVAYLGMGVAYLAAILVSILAGTLTIPAAAWLARRTSGAGAGAAAAALVAFSGFHLALSRVAHTDAPFPLCWILGLVRGQRFLERPGLCSAIAPGLSVGLARWFKYNGWPLGVFVVLAALSGGPAWNVTESLAAVLGCKLVLLPPGKPYRCRASLPLAIFALVLPVFYWWLGAGWVLDPRQRRSPGKRLPAAAWLGLSILTPFYHPNARIWLPPHFPGWIMAANLINQEFPTPRPKPGKSASALETGNPDVINPWEWIARGIAMPAIELSGADMFRSPTLSPGELPGPPALSDSLRNGVRKAVADLPAGTPGLRPPARSPVLFYAGVRVPVRVEPDPARLLAPGDPGVGPWWTWPSCVGRGTSRQRPRRSLAAGSSSANTRHS